MKFFKKLWNGFKEGFEDYCTMKEKVYEMQYNG